MPGHDERLSVPLWWWAAGFAVGALLAAELHMGYAGVRSWLPYVLILPAVAGLLWWLGRVRVRVADGELLVDDARLPLRYVAAAEPLTGAAKRIAMGPALHPLAFVVHRPWVAGAVKVVLDDPDDPTPYWIVSSRHAPELAAALSTRPASSPAS